MNEEWIPIVMFVGMTIVFSLLVWFRFQAKSEMQRTIRMALEKGQELSPELLEKLALSRRSPIRDLRLAAIWISIAMGFIGLSLTIPEEEARKILMGIAAFPLSLGVAYLLIWKFAGSEQ